MTTNTTATCVADDQYSAQIIRAWCASCGMPEPSNGECLALSVALSTAAAQPPAGWVMVPVEPTHAQAKAAADAWLDCGSRLFLNKALAALRAGIAAAPKAEPAPAGEHPALHDLFREALAWGMTYGPEIPAHQWDEMRESMVKQYADRAMRDQPAVAPAAPTPSEWDVRGRLAASLTCWHRLTGQEAAELVALFQGHPAQAAPAAVAGPFQARVQPWLLACFGEMIAGDREERNHRFLEEALELVQSLGCTQSEAHQLVDYVYGRTVGIPAQEVGGVMVTLAALCLANGMDMHDAGEVELTRINDPVVVEKIRAKQAAKPKYSPLPMAAPLTQVAPRPAAQQGKPSAYALKWPNVLRINLSTVFDTEAEAQAYLKRCTPGVVMVPLYANPAAPVVQGDALIDAARFASDVLAEVYTKYQVKIGPFASQAQLANVRLRDALKGAARSQAKEGGAA